MSTPPDRLWPTTTHRALRVGVLVVAALYVLAFVTVAGLRLRYPFEIEWLEGGGLEHVRRILAGQPIYVRPSLAFVAYLYTPFYFYCSAAAAWLTGEVSLLPMRLVSLTASLGVFAAIAAIVRRETGRWYPSFLAAGLMAATYSITSGWFDLARVDSLFLAVTLWGIYLVQAGTPRSLVAGGFCLALAVFVKQTALLIGLPVMVWSAFHDRRRSWWLIAPFAAVLVLTTLYLQYTTDGWYWYYVFDLQRRAGTFLPLRIVRFWTRDVLRWVGIAAVFGGWYLVTAARGVRSRGARVVAVAAVAMVVGAWLSRLRSGNVANVLMPAYAGIGILWGLQVAELEQRWARLDLRGPRTRQTLVYLSCLVQLAVLAYDPRTMVPTPADEQAGHRLVGRIAAVAGDVFVPCHQYLATLAGKQSYAHIQGIFDVLRSGDAAMAEPLMVELRAAFERRRFGAVIPCAQHRRYLDAAGFSAFYVQEETFFDPADRTFLTRAGVPLRPEALYVPATPPRD